MKNIISVYFTPFPYLLYKQANSDGNMAYAGIGLGLIHCQRMFWISNTILYLTSSYSNNRYLIVYLFCIYLYGFSIIKTKYLLAFMNCK